MTTWLRFAVVASLAILAVVVLGSAAEACPYAERAAAAAAEQNAAAGAAEGGCSIGQWAAAVAGGWLALFVGSYAYGMRRFRR